LVVIRREELNDVKVEVDEACYISLISWKGKWFSRGAGMFDVEISIVLVIGGGRSERGSKS
jgi:hypothetical protein